MKIQTTPNLQFNSKNRNEIKPQSKSDVSFKGLDVPFVQFLNFLETNQALGASFVDVTCMGIPRSTVDFTRGPDAGFETMRREFSSTADDALVGAYGLGAAYLLAQGLNKKFKVDAHKMIISDEMVDILSHNWNEKRTSTNNKPLEASLKQVFADVKGYNPDYVGKAVKDDKGFVKIEESVQNDIVKKAIAEIEKPSKDGGEAVKKYISSKILTSTGATRKFRLEKTIGNEKVVNDSSLDTFIDNVFKVSKAFMNDEIANTFKNGQIEGNEFLKRLKGLNKWTSIAGLAVATGIGCSLQPINMYITRKKTGKTGFVGVEGREPDKTTGFKALKALAAAAGCFGVMRSIGGFKEIPKLTRFKGLIPTIPQFKLIYGMTIVSRFLSARDKNELRESSIKDTLGYVNWLILGGFVSKLTASGFEKIAKFKDNGEKFIKYNKNENGAKWIDWLTKSDVVTREEVLSEAFKKAGVSTIKADGKTAMSFKEMLKIASKSENQALKMAKSKLKYLNMIQLAGYVYSGVVLGVGIPKLNIAITNSIEKKHKAKMEKEKAEKTAA